VRILFKYLLADDRIQRSPRVLGGTMVSTDWLQQLHCTNKSKHLSKTAAIH
jgi:hypothetical protein